MDKKTGVAEWAQASMNFQRGCEHNCRYCYARYNAVKRFSRCRDEHWKLPCIDEKKVDKAHKIKYPGRVMFPTTHDITPANISQYQAVLRKLLDAGNQILIVTKPHWECITFLCETFIDYRDKIMFRFTIGSTQDDVLEFWEPGATKFSERISCLQYAFKRGFETSVSCEPFLDRWPEHVYIACKPYLTDSFWIGIINLFDARVVLDDATEDQIDKYVTPLRAMQTDQMIKIIHKQLDGQRFIKWKCSITEIASK